MDEIKQPTQEELTLYLREETFADQVFQQLVKEFIKIGIEIQLQKSDFVTLEQFNKRLGEELELLANNAKSNFNQLLYLSDLPENKVNDIFELSENPMEELAHLLLIRTAQKIYLRKKYSAKP